MVNSKIFDLLIQANAIELGGHYEIFPNTYSPIYFDFRKFFENPRLFDILTDLLADVTREINPEKIAGAFTSGIPLATAISLKTNLPIVFVRRQPKEYGSRAMIEGTVKEGENVMIVDDIFSTLKNNEAYINALRSAKANVRYFLVIFDYGMTPPEKLLEAGIEVISLITAKDLLIKLEKWGKITKEERMEYMRILKYSKVF